MALKRWLVVVALGACDLNVTFTVDRPIALVPDPSWSDEDVQSVARAAKCWETQFGVPFTFDASPTDQRIDIGFDKIVCIGANKGGQYSPPAQIDLCPVDLVQPRLFAYFDHAAARADIIFIVVLHELGHSIGILGHADSDLAVMGGQTALSALAAGYTQIPRTTAFTPEDVALFEKANGHRASPCSGEAVAARFGGEPVGCYCAVPCEPDVFEPNNNRGARIDRTGSWELQLCNDEYDYFSIEINARVRVESSCGPRVTFTRDSARYDQLEFDARVDDFLMIRRDGFGLCDYRLVVE
ncbi:MAG TPA: hypothetical protein VIV11_05715 [Kofleriaceae bacterium]